MNVRFRKGVKKLAKHELWELKQMQSLPLQAKIRMTQTRIKGWYEEFDGNVYVARSGGKDSDVLGDIVKKMYPDVPHVFVNTGLEFDSVRIHGTEVADEVLRPEMSFVQVITKTGYPVISKSVSHSVRIARNNPNGKVMENIFNNPKKGSKFDYTKYKYLLDAPFRISDLCCDYSKKKPSFIYEKNTGRKPILATMACESFLRQNSWLKNGCNAFEAKHKISQPLSFWTEQDILIYIKLYGLEIASVYGNIAYKDTDGMFYENDLFNSSMKLHTTGENRTGCVFCMFGITQDTERFLRLKEIEPKKYDYVMRGGKFDEQGLWIPHNGLGYKFVIDWINKHGNLDIKY